MLGAIDLMVQDYLKVQFPFITCFPDKRNYTALPQQLSAYIFQIFI